MRSLTTLLRATLPALALLAATGTASLAGGFSHDRVYADSFGNLVVESAAGYKRIIVGEGERAEQLSKFTSAGQADIDVVYADDGAGRHVVNDCYRPPALIKGRSYMYGFDEGEIPFQGGPCR